MRRAARVVIEAHTAEGETFRLTGEGLLARVWQHENDHLDGRLIVDNMSTTDEIANRRALKQLRDEYKSARRK
jgi:peptide deformylase